MSVQIAAFYRFVALPDYAELRAPLLAQCRERELKGTILLAAEGINSTLAGQRSQLESFLDWLAQDPRLAGLEPKWSQAAEMPFQRLKVRLKQEIVTLGQPVDPGVQVGRYVAPQDWNALIQQPDVLLLDTRNHYEVKIGTFRGAIDPQTDSFREFPDYVRQHLDPQQHRRLATFCTGGIRCEKATAWLLEAGFEEVYHLEGGILKYLETVAPQDSLWEGECFVFDGRVAVEQGVGEGHFEMCRGCGGAVSAADRASAGYEAGVCCPACEGERTPEQKVRARARVRQEQLARNSVSHSARQGRQASSQPT